MTGNCFGIANGRAVRQGNLYVDTLGGTQGNLQFNAKIPNRTLDLCMTKQKLDRAEVAGLFQALRFGVVAGSFTLGMICPPTPSQPVHQHRAGSRIVSSVARTAFRSLLAESVLQRHSTAQSPYRPMLQCVRMAACL